MPIHLGRSGFVRFLDGVVGGVVGVGIWVRKKVSRFGDRVGIS